MSIKCDIFNDAGKEKELSASLCRFRVCSLKCICQSWLWFVQCKSLVLNFKLNLSQLNSSAWSVDALHSLVGAFDNVIKFKLKITPCHLEKEIKLPKKYTKITLAQCQQRCRRCMVLKQSDVPAHSCATTSGLSSERMGANWWFQACPTGTCWRHYMSHLALEHLCVPSDELDEEAGEGGLDISV